MTIGIGTGFLLLFFLIAGLFFLRAQVRKSFPVTSGSIQAAGVHKPVRVHRDELGIPHIVAHDEHDLMFGMGYVHAQDRLWQMDMGRRAGQGRLSEVFGRATLRYDMLFRTLGFVRLADTLVRTIHPNARRMLEDYSSGVNAFILDNAGKLPVEFDMLDYAPEPWTPAHSLLLARLMAWELNFAWWTDLTYAEIAEKVPPEKFAQILPGESEFVHPVAGSDAPPPGLWGARSFMEDVAGYREFSGQGPFSSGSNAWVVAAEKSLSGKPILANDPHLKVSAPARWYEAHLSAPGWNIAGVTIPGSPVVVIGRNDSLAWGMTNAMIDNADFYIEKADTSATDRIFDGGRSVPMQIRRETILVRSSDSVTITVRSTRHGPVVNDVHPRSEHDSAGAAFRPPVALRWSGFDLSDEFNGFYKMDRATNAVEFEEGVREIAVPGQCVVYADARSNIGMWTAARVPLRPGRNPLLPAPGWTGEAEWKGHIPFDRLPKLWNPAEGFIVSANQKIGGKGYPYYLSSLWEPPARSERIRALLRSSEKFSADDFMQFQQDVTSEYCRNVTPAIVGAFASDSTSSPEVRGALEYLRNWDFRSTPTDIASSIFNVFLVKLLHRTFEDEMGPGLFNDFVYFTAIPYRVTEQLLKNDTSAWFDNTGTPDVERRDDIIRQSFADALSELHENFGPEMKTWQWGKLHRAVFEHPFGSRKPLDRVFNTGPFPAPGCGTTVNRGDFRLAGSYDLFSAASMREIVDMAHSDALELVIPLGQSGQPFHKHYSDQTSLWLNGGYHRVSINATEIAQSPWERVQLEPPR